MERQKCIMLDVFGLGSSLLHLKLFSSLVKAASFSGFISAFDAELLVCISFFSSVKIKSGVVVGCCFFFALSLSLFKVPHQTVHALVDYVNSGKTL